MGLPLPALGALVVDLPAGVARQRHIPPIAVTAILAAARGA